MIIIYFLFLFTFLIGYYLGTKRSVINDLLTGKELTLNEIMKTYEKLLPKEKLEVGPIKRPSVQYYKEKEIDPLRKEGLDAMEKDFRNIPELNK